MMVVAVTAGDSFQVGRPELLFEDPAILEPEFDASPDGERFLMIQHDENASREIRVVLELDEELKRLAPPDD
jgi:hypothetical protein